MSTQPELEALREAIGWSSDRDPVPDAGMILNRLEEFGWRLTFQDAARLTTLRSTSRDSEVREAIEALRNPYEGGNAGQFYESWRAFEGARTEVLRLLDTHSSEAAPTLDDAWETVERSLPKGSPEWDALIRAAVLAGRRHSSGAAPTTVPHALVETIIEGTIGLTEPGQPFALDVERSALPAASEAAPVVELPLDEAALELAIGDTLELFSAAITNDSGRLSWWVFASELAPRYAARLTQTPAEDRS